MCIRDSRLNAELRRRKGPRTVRIRHVPLVGAPGQELVWGERGDPAAVGAPHPGRRRTQRRKRH
eukprot:12349550-Alexandrium_andersonii.AAC.1